MKNQLFIKALALNDVDPFGVSCLRQTLTRSCLFYPLASLDVSGQQPVFIKEPHPTSFPNLLIFETIFYYKQYLRIVNP